MTVVNAWVIRSATVCNIWLMWVDDFSFGERHLCVLDSTKDLCYFTITAMNNFVISAGLTKKVAKAVLL